LQIIIAEKLDVDPEKHFSLMFESEEADILPGRLIGDFPTEMLDHLVNAA